MDKLHKNCKHWDKPCSEEPCKSCLNFGINNKYMGGKYAFKTEWEPKEDKEDKGMDVSCSTCEYTGQNCDCDNYSAWIPEKKLVKETVNTWEMFKALMENPKRKAVDEEGYEIYVRNGHFCHNPDGSFVILGNTNRWTIIEPLKQLKKMTTGEVMCHIKDNPCHTQIKSLETNEMWKGFMTSHKALNGLWEVEGVY